MPIETEIKAKLYEIAASHDVTILFAIESGSRAWGFESTDSDWDIRFVYLSRLETYLTVHPRRDVIENSDVVNDNPLLDFSGWDLRKYLGLITKSNPVAFEWLRSTIGYHKTDAWQAVCGAASPFFSPKAAMHHYLSIARHNYREHMRDGMAASVRLKKYLYITRPLLCCRWIERDPTAGPPPMPFAELLAADSLGGEVSAALTDLVARKRRGEELDEGSAIPCINRFIDTELWRLRTVADGMPVGAGRIGDLDKVLYQLASS